MGSAPFKGIFYEKRRRKRRHHGSVPAGQSGRRNVTFRRAPGKPPDALVQPYRHPLKENQVLLPDGFQLFATEGETLLPARIGKGLNRPMPKKVIGKQTAKKFLHHFL
jgi:hypothetical protein